MTKEKETLCRNCKYFDGICKHKSNIIIHINKRIEKEAFKTKEQKTKCEFFAE